MKIELLRVEYLKKKFNNISALRNIHFNVYQKEIFGIVGLIGSGKSVLVNILSGVHPADTGVIYFDDQQVNITCEADAKKLGIYCINEISKLIPNLSIAENIFVIRNDSDRRYIKHKRHIYMKTKILLNKLAVDIDPNITAGRLSQFQQHTIEMLKAVSLNAKLLIMDNVTERYSKAEYLKFKDIISQICKNGISVILVTNKLNDLLGISSRTMVIREGATVGLLSRKEYNNKKLQRLLAGYNLNDVSSKIPAQVGSAVLSVKGLSSVNGINNISFNLYNSEILGFLELSGDGIELAYSLFGLRSCTGDIILNRASVKLNDITAAINAGIALVPEDILSAGLFYNLDLNDNINILMLKKYHAFGNSKKRFKQFTAKVIKEKLQIFIDNGYREWSIISRTDQMKIVIAKWLATNPKMIILINPFISTDEISKNDIFEIINSIAGMDICIVIISTNYDSLSKICNRILVLKDGRISKEMSCYESNESE